MKDVRAGKTLPAVDMRYLKKGVPSKSEKGTDTSRQRIVSFLQGIYDSVAETLPDVRDDTCEFSTEEVTIEVPELADPYVKALHSNLESDDKKKSKKKVRTRKSSIELNADRKHAQEDRYLPPGHIRDFWEQFKVSSEQGVAFSTFWRVWHQDFPFLKFRPSSSHAQCGTCLRHKLLIKGFTGHLKARQEQVKEYVRHLRSQYNDRVEYWSLRGRSRLAHSTEVLMILDGMDQAKFSYPRSNVFASKELSGLNRPRAHISGLIAHGKFVLFTVSPANVPKDATSCIETTAHALHLLSKECDISKITLNIQSDNTTREVKNNHYLRWLASLVSQRCLPRCF